MESSPTSQQTTITILEALVVSLAILKLEKTAILAIATMLSSAEQKQIFIDYLLENEDSLMEMRTDSIEITTTLLLKAEEIMNSIN